MLLTDRVTAVEAQARAISFLVELGRDRVQLRLGDLACCVLDQSLLFGQFEKHRLPAVTGPVLLSRASSPSFGDSLDGDHGDIRPSSRQRRGSAPLQHEAALATALADRCAVKSSMSSTCDAGMGKALVPCLSSQPQSRSAIWSSSRLALR